MRTHVTEQMIDPIIGRRIFTLCWFCAGLGVSILQMQLLAQAWSVHRQALAPACIVSAWVLGSLVGSRRRTTARMWGGCLLACTLLWCVGTRLVSWPTGLVPTTWLSDGALIIIAMVLGVISTMWLLQQRPWPEAFERAALARGLLGTTAGLCAVWMLPTWAGLIALACLIPLWFSTVDLPGVVLFPRLGVWSRIGSGDTGILRASKCNWRCAPCHAPGGGRIWQDVRRNSSGYIPLTLLASGSAVILGVIWGAVPTPFAAGLAGTHELGKLGWLLGGQIVALVFGACCALVARNLVGFPDRVVPPTWQARAFALALSMLVILAGSLVTLGLPFLQAPWWLAVSLASYTLAGAIWGLLLPRLRPSTTTLAVAQRHRWLGQGTGRLDTYHLAHGCAQEERVTRLFATTEGILIAVSTPVVGLLIDLYGSVDRVLVIIGLFFLLGLTLLALTSVLGSLKQPQRTQFARSALRERPTHSWRPGYSLVRSGLAW